MNNLHRELAPVSDAAWTEIEEEAARTVTRNLAGRRVVELSGPHGPAFSAVGTGRTTAVADPLGDGVSARRREALHVVELRVPFELDRTEIDGVERGAPDADWQPVKNAARAIALAEDRAVFDGYPAAGITGIRPSASTEDVVLPADIREYPTAIAQALNQLRTAGVDGPYSVALGAEAYTLMSETRDHGYPVLEHVQRLVSDEIVWAPAIEGGVVLSTRGGDFDLQVGTDIAIGYESHTAASVRLYLYETFTFRTVTTEAAVSLTPAP